IADLVCELALVKNEIFKYKNTIEENEFQRNLNFLGSLSNQILKKLKKVNISPSNFSVTEALVLQSGKNIYAIPLKNTTEILLFHQGKKEKWINSFPGNARFLHHQKDYPLFSLEEILSGNPQNTTDELLQNETSINLVLLNYAGKELALIPEKILDIDYLVVKAPGKVLEGLSLFTGASTTPGGNIVFVINPEFIETYGSEIKKPEIYQTTSKEKTNQELESLLLFETEGKHFAIHTGIIQLVQKIHSDILHLEANPPLIEIRGKEIGLVPLPETIFSPQKEKGSEGYVIVFHKDESLKGIIADNILGTTEEYQVAKVDSNSAPESNHFSILGKSTIKEKDTLLLGI
ncbi:MAG: chemotaxis protein CheW, partial [Leptospiraceae bacterium]|nr:chemotaxis protein CheW [Leptospiraceae bacterium]